MQGSKELRGEIKKLQVILNNLNFSGRLELTCGVKQDNIFIFNQGKLKGFVGIDWSEGCLTVTEK